ncbi:DMT family transporter [Sulfurospirillum cavolei]|uniref:DMT family transporter n=1 Tax=Sulfurospirillum cavolei TaxID=366522 RepID=UPI0005A6DF19|nr:DMT family transporter [Sulfurospirillum cavolei]
MPKEIKAHLLVLLNTFLVAGSFIASQKIAGLIHPISLTLLRFVLASILLSPFIFFNSTKREKLTKTFPKAMMISLFYSLYFIAFFKALEITTALNTGTLYTLVPLVTAILCIFFFKERISPFQLLIYLCGIMGTVTIVFKGELSLLLHFSINRGDFIFLSAVLFMAIYSILTKFLHHEEDDVLVLVFMTLIGGCLWMFAALMLMDIPLQWERITGNALFDMLYLVIGATLLTVYLTQKASIVIGPKKVMAYVYINPASIALLLYLIEGTTLTWDIGVGIGVSAVSTLLLLNHHSKR